MLRQLSRSELKEVREEILRDQGQRCAICGEPIEGLVCLDHQHKDRRVQEPGENGAGLVRGVLCSACNAMEGKFWNAGKRYRSQKTVAERLTWLRQLIQYYEKGHYPLIYPGEGLPRPKVSKLQLKRLAKASGKTLEYPASGYLTKPLEKLFKKYDIDPFRAK